MPQVYVAVYDPGPPARILIVKKRIENGYWRRRLVPPTIVNQAGQWALPGGALEPRDHALPEMTAQREFLEETGLDLRPYARGEVILVRTPRYIVVGFAVTAAQLEAICLTVHRNVQPRRGDDNRPAGDIHDWELAEAQIIPMRDLPQRLGLHQPLPPEDPQAVAAVAAARPDSQAIDWYREIAHGLQGGFAPGR